MIEQSSQNQKTTEFFLIYLLSFNNVQVTKINDKKLIHCVWFAFVTELEENMSKITKKIEIFDDRKY